MLKKGKKLLSVLLVVLMLMTSAPLSIMAELDFTSLVPDLSVRSQAVNTTYNAVAAAEYAKKYALSYNKEWYFYNSGGDCANFVSQALFAAGMPMTADWHAYDSVSHAYRMDGGSGYGFTWIRAQNLADYLVSIGGQKIVNPSASDISIGDAIFYDWDGGRLDHSAVVTDIINGVPRVSAHSTPESASKLNENWTYNRSSNKIVLIKLYGKTCEENNSPNYDYYHMNSTTGVYASPSYSTTSIGSVSYLDTVRVIKTTTSGGVKWGYFNYKGNWGWVDLSKATYKGHFDRIQVNHIFGNWFTVKQATCVEDGLERHICSRCGFTEDRTIAKGGHVAVPATCTKASVCSACGITLAPALGHNFTQWVSVAVPTCVDKEKFERTCKRCNFVEEKYGELGDHNYVATVTIPGCTADGTSAMKCTYCGNGYIEDIGDGWSSWTTTANSTLLQNSSLYQKKTQYRYRDKEFTESTNANLSGWTKYDTKRTSWGATQGPVYSDPSNGSRNVWSEQYVTSSNYKTVYKYWRYAASQYGTSGYSYKYQASGTNYYEYESDRALTYKNSSQTGGVPGYAYPVGSSWFLVWECSPCEQQKWVSDNYGTRWYYQEPVYTYYYYKWPSTWSNWQDTAVSGTSDRQVETRTVYRYKLAALNHDFGDPTVVPEKCTEKGYTEKICKRCGFQYKYDYVKALGHNMGAWYTVVEATPDTAGLERRDCQRVGCNYFETRGHSLVKEIIDPTCTEDGYTLLTCSDEGCTVEYKTDPVSALDHDLGDLVEMEAATCEKDGLGRRYCSRCEYYKDEPIPAHGHNYQKKEDKSLASTCTKGGYDYYECSYASEHNYTVELDPLGHRWSEWEDHQPSKCGEEGYWFRTCDRCHEEEQKDFYYIEHDWVVTEEHDPTCLEDGYTVETCVNEWPDGSCGETRTTIGEPAPGHDFGPYYKIKEETCTEEGLERADCVRGDAYDERAIPPLGHEPDNNWVQTKAPTCSAEGEEECKCVRHDDGVTCDKIYIRPVPIDPEAHDWSDEWQVITEATMYEPGEEICHCKIDENHTQTREIPVRTYYTATFKVGDETVAEIRFEPGTKYISEPDLKPYDKDNYTVDWEEYTLNDADIVINAVYTPIDPDDISDLDPDKTVDNYENGIATITLSASAASRTIRFVSKANVTPLDVVLVLDRSGSMDDPLGNNSRVKKIDKLKDSANLFLEKLYENAQSTGADHRVALVGFGSGSGGYSSGDRWSSLNYEGTGVMITNSSGEISYRDIENGKWNAWGDTLIPVGDEKGVNARLTSCINAIKANGATQTDLGLNMAENILGAYENTPDRKRMVILITDGNPTNYGNTETAINAVAPPAITYAEEIKSSGVSIYTIGVTADANPDAKFNSSPTGITGSGDKVDFDFNRFLNIVSSNYPQAQAMDNYGEKVNSGYYIGVNDVEKGLENALEKIFINTVEKPLIFKKATIYDTLSKDFTLTLEQEQAMREKLTSEYGMADEDIIVTRNEDGTTTLRFVDVPVVKTLVDGNIRYVAKVTFDCSLNQYEAGDYETNTDDAGVEIDGENAAQFEKPQQIHLSSDRNIVVFTINGEVYRIWEGNLGDKVIVPETDLAKWNIDETVDGNYAVYEADEINSDQYTVTWIVDGTETVETYTFAQKIVAPVPADKDNLEFKGWSPSVPNIMPAKNMQFTAVFGPRHEHSYTKLSINGNCETGLIQVKACSCGAYITENLGTRQHSYYSIVDCYTEHTVHEVLNCDYCEQIEEHTLRFEISKGKTATVINFNLLQEGVEVQPNGNGIKIMIPMSSLGLRQKDSVYVKRVNDDGTKKDFEVTKENGYIVFYADHFSYYVIGLLDENGVPVEDIGYEDAYCIVNGHSYTQTVVVDPTCTEDGYTKHTCEVCGSSYNDSEVPAFGHDFNENSVCKTCGYDKKLDCDCGCHKNPVIKLIYFFIGILYKIFGLEFHCTCGIVH